jgi:hypothetical protein
MGRTGKKIDPQEDAPQKIERAKEEIKERTFANPQTGDEAEPDLPSLEHLANGYNAISLSDGGEYKIMTKEQILKRGTLLQKIRLYIGSIDLSGYFEAKEELTENELNYIRASIKTKEDKELVRLCVNEYNTIFDFGTRLSFFFKRFQTSYAILAVLLNKWESYEYTAKQLTLLYSLMKNSFIDICEDGEGGLQLGEEIYPEETRENFIQDLLYSNVLDGATLKFNKETENFYIDVEEKGGLYSKILEEAKSATKDLSDFKAYTTVAEDYINKSTLKFMPTNIQISIENAEEERYTRYLVKNLRYFRSELNQRKARGESITPEDEKRAVIPDFYEVKPSKNVLADCKTAIKKT